MRQVQQHKKLRSGITYGYLAGHVSKGCPELFHLLGGLLFFENLQLISPHSKGAHGLMGHVLDLSHSVGDFFDHLRGIPKGLNFLLLSGWLGAPSDWPSRRAPVVGSGASGSPISFGG